MVSVKDPRDNKLIDPKFEVSYYKVREYRYKAKCKNEKYQYTEGYLDEPYKEEGQHMGIAAAEIGKGSVEKIYASTTALAKYKVTTIYTWENNAIYEIANTSNHGY